MLYDNIHFFIDFCFYIKCFKQLPKFLDSKSEILHHVLYNLSMCFHILLHNFKKVVEKI